MIPVKFPLSRVVIVMTMSVPTVQFSHVPAAGEGKRGRGGIAENTYGHLRRVICRAEWLPYVSRIMVSETRCV